MTRLLTLHAAVLLLCVAGLSCGDVVAGPTSTSVGAACTMDSDCTNRCLADDSRFPGGACTISCETDANCPSGSVCISHMSGVCVTACRTSADCAGFGRGFACAGDSAASGGEVLVCRAP
jgi:hypothetical protein